MPDACYGAVTVLLSNVTAALRARALPCRLVPVFKVTAWRAMIVPLKMEFVPRVAELPTCQNTFLAWAPPDNTTWVLPKVVSVEAIWKMKTAFASPWASSVTFPADKMTVLEFFYRPGAKVRPLRSPGSTAPPSKPSA
jgi:hypothetical protein